MVDFSDASARARRLKLLEEDVSVCTACGLHETRTNTAFSRGSPFSRLMFVGEAPGEIEDLNGIPFTGKAGKMLDKMIEWMGIDPTTVYITNTNKCRPPGNRAPTPAEMHTCKHYLYAQIQQVKPRVIVALGKTASFALADDVPTELLFPEGWRGRWRKFMEIDVMTTYHPAYLLRTPAAKEDVKKDLAEVLEKLK